MIIYRRKETGLLMVKEDSAKKKLAKRVDIVSLRLMKDTSLLYKDRMIRSPEDGYNLFKQFLGESDREYFVFMCLDVKNQPTAINICHIESLNSSIVHPRQVMKIEILSNSVSILVAHPSVGAARIVNRRYRSNETVSRSR